MDEHGYECEQVIDTSLQELIDALSKIQRDLRVPKKQYNPFGKFKFRSCEDILEALKPNMPKHSSIILLDELIMVGARYYIKSTARFYYKNNYMEAYGYAREEEERKGFDASQITGSASSYARKYALNGLLDIDDVKDSDVIKRPDIAMPESKSQISVEQAKRFFALAKRGGATNADIKKWLQDNYGLASTTEIGLRQYEEICSRLATEIIQKGDDNG